MAWGRIGYRAVGNGRPLVLVSGTYDSIDFWSPSFVDALAHRHRVLAIDNEGVGRTTLRPGPLTITRMAQDTADFVAALHLKRPDVLGFSMGGFIVQALAIRHPASVRRVVLCSTGPGDGSNVPSTGSRSTPLYADLFPPDQDAARLAFIGEIHSYPGFYLAPSSVVPLQGMATAGWWAGSEPVGHQLRRLRAPTLIGQGAEDPLEPVANAQILARAIPHARLHVYADASHGFLFQDAADWVRRIARFLA